MFEDLLYGEGSGHAEVCPVCGIMYSLYWRHTMEDCYEHQKFIKDTLETITRKEENEKDS